MKPCVLQFRPYLNVGILLSFTRVHVMQCVIKSMIKAIRTKAFFIKSSKAVYKILVTLSHPRSVNHPTVCINDLDKLNMVQIAYGGLV